MSKLQILPHPKSGRIRRLKSGAIYDHRHTSGKSVSPYSEESFGPFHDAHAFHFTAEEWIY